WTASPVGGSRTCTSSTSGGSMTYGGSTILLSSRGTEASGIGGLTCMHFETQPLPGAQSPARSSHWQRYVPVLACMGSPQSDPAPPAKTAYGRAAAPDDWSYRHPALNSCNFINPY